MNFLFVKRWRWHSIVLFLIIVFTCAIFWPMIDNFFREDDFTWQADAYINWHHPYHIFTRTQSGYFNPLLHAMMLFNYMVCGSNSMGYYLISLMFHIVTVIFTYYLAFLITRQRIVALITSFLFAVHFPGCEALLWISGRPQIIVTLFYISTIILFIKYIEEGKKQYYWFSFVALLLAFLTKEPAATAILPLFLYAMIFEGKKTFFAARFLRKYIPFILATAAYLFYEYKIQITPYSLVGIGDYTLTSNFLTVELNSLLTLFRNSFLTDFRIYSPLVILSRPGIIFSLCSLLVVGSFLMWQGRWIKKHITPINKRMYQSLTFSFFWIFITFLPFSFFTWPGYRVTGVPSRYFYLSSVGYAIFLGTLFFILWTGLGSIKRPLLRKIFFPLKLLLISALLFFAVRNCVLIQKTEREYDYELNVNRKILYTLKSYYPTLPDVCKLYFVDIPRFCHFSPGHFRVAIVLYYPNLLQKSPYQQDFEVDIIGCEDIKNIPQSQNTYVFEYREEKLHNITSNIQHEKKID